MTNGNNDVVFIKLRNVLGSDRALALFRTTLHEMKIDQLRTPDDRLRFGELLIERGGVFAALGRSIKIQAILHGASSS